MQAVFYNLNSQASLNELEDCRKEILVFQLLVMLFLSSGIIFSQKLKSLKNSSLKKWNHVKGRPKMRRKSGYH